MVIGKILVYWLIQIFWMLAYFIIHYQKIILISLPFSLEWPFKYWEIVNFTLVNSGFPKFKFSLEENTICCFPWSSQSICSFLKKCESLPNTQSGNPLFVCHFFFASKNYVPWKHNVVLLVAQWHNFFSLEIAIILPYATEMLPVYFSFHHTEYL